ncbi:transcriptional regulator of RNA polII, SAGA, subunit-domain-containing protein [Delphinella strobiligena]|nr:transcriptional regulator of RNA polII, SAGA, subunit-domain-containing protein [Delphinella strobiligena]
MDPAQFQRRDTSLPQLDGLTDTPTSKTLQTPISAKIGPKNGAMAPPRIDTEPIYTALKAALGEGFGTYRDGVAGFVLGKLNQAELTQILSRLLSQAPSASTSTSTESKEAKLISTVHLHNQLICALHANIFREPPPDTIAPWVLAPDDAANLTQHSKAGAAGGAANEAEERLKREVMALSARDRRRIKNLKDSGEQKDGLESRDSGPLAENIIYNQALTVPTSAIDAESSILEGKGSLAKTNWDVEIKRRYAMPLAAETLEFPSRTEIQSRIEPICYEEGLGLTANTPLSTSTLQSCAELVETATEMFVKEVLERWIYSTRTNGEGMPMTSTFKSQLRKEEDAVERGELAKTPAGLLPCEAEVAAHREQLSIDELRLSLRLDNARLPLDPFLVNRLLGDVDVDMDAYDVPTPPDAHDIRLGASARILPNGSALANGVKEGAALPDGGDLMVVDADDWGWSGAAREDRNALMGVLDSALTLDFF